MLRNASLGAFCYTFDLHQAIICIENKVLVFFLSGQHIRLSYTISTPALVVHDRFTLWRLCTKNTKTCVHVPLTANLPTPVTIWFTCTIGFLWSLTAKPSTQVYRQHPPLWFPSLQQQSPPVSSVTSNMARECTPRIFGSYCIVEQLIIHTRQSLSCSHSHIMHVMDENENSSPNFEL